MLLFFFLLLNTGAPFLEKISATAIAMHVSDSRRLLGRKVFGGHFGLTRKFGD